MDNTVEEVQKCFLGDDNYWRCNFVVRKGKKIESKKGIWLKFPALPSTIIKKLKLLKDKNLQAVSDKS